MAFLPIIERELRMALRKQQPVRRRLRVAAAGAGGTLLFFLLAELAGRRSASHDLHQLLCLAGFYVVARAPHLAAGAFSQERREQTLGFLFLSALSATDVFVSKVFSAAAVAFTDLLAIVPTMALPFLMGGISFELFLATICCLPNLLLFALAVSLLASVLTEEEGAAISLAWALLLVLCLAGPVMRVAHSYFSSGASSSEWWLRLSPAYGPWLVFTRFRSAPAAEFWNNFVITLAWSGVCLAIAAFALARLWQEREVYGTKTGWRGRWREFLHGKGEGRRLASQWLEVNPFTWLCLRDRKPSSLAWSIVISVSSAWLVCWAIWPTTWPSVPNFFITATLLNLVLRWIIHHTAAAGLGNSRRDGSYELLLTTRLEPSDIVWGQLDALHQHFKAVSRAVFAIEAAMMLAGLGLRSWNGPALFVYLGIWAALLFWEWHQSWNQRGALLSMWASLNSARPAYAVWRTLGFNSWIWLWILFNLRHGLRGLQSFPTGSEVEFGLVFLGAFILIAFVRLAPAKSNVLEQRLISEFREIIREPVPDPHDPRFKQWNPRGRFPWGWQILQQQLHERVARRARESAS